MKKTLILLSLLLLGLTACHEDIRTPKNFGVDNRERNSLSYKMENKSKKLESKSNPYQMKNHPHMTKTETKSSGKKNHIKHKKKYARKTIKAKSSAVAAKSKPAKKSSSKKQMLMSSVPGKMTCSYDPKKKTSNGAYQCEFVSSKK